MGNIINQFKLLANYNLYSPLLVIAISFICISAILLVINTKLKNKVIEIIYCSILITLLICVLYFYRGVIFSSLDLLIENILKSLLFPSLVHILSILILSIIILFYVLKLFNEKKWFTVTSVIICAMLLIFNIVSLIIIANTDNIYYVYKNGASLLIMQLSAFIFYIYLIFFIIVRLKYRKKGKRKVLKENVKKTKEGIEILSFD